MSDKVVKLRGRAAAGRRREAGEGSRADIVREKIRAAMRAGRYAPGVLALQELVREALEA